MAAASPTSLAARRRTSMPPSRRRAPPSPMPAGPARPPAARKKTLQRFAEKILAAKDELALLETLDMGKPVQYSLAVDVASSARTIAWYAEAVDKIYDEIAPTPASALALITREPMGVIGAMVPWNYPMIMAAWKLGPALAAGNSVVLKPSEKSPLTAMRLAELAVEAGLPEGVFNVVPGFGHEAGEALALHMDVDAIGFTGSTRVGRKMLEYAGRSNLKRVYNELGGKSAFVVFDDFEDIARAARTVAGSMFFNQGESCNAPSRVFVHETVADEFLAVVAAEAPKYAPGDPLSGHPRWARWSTRRRCAPCSATSTPATAMARSWSPAASARAARPAASTSSRPCSTGVSNQMKIAREEIFGPVMSVIRFKTEAEAIAMANDSSYGLQASVWSHNINRAHRVARALRAGTVHVNQYDEDDITVPFGGYKQSGNGRDKSLHAFDKYTELKTTWLRIDAA
jgi:acyl-CoA reductase-like NAD-dependent aldehyde dehydrogenase